MKKRVSAAAGPTHGARGGTLPGWLPALAVAALIVVASTSGAVTPAREPLWLGTWAASPQPPEPPSEVPVPARFENQTIRQIVHTGLGGKMVRVRLSNEFGTEPLVVGSAHIGLQADGVPSSLRAGSGRVLTFGHHSRLTVAPGAAAVSDPVGLDVAAFDNLAISLYLPHATPVGTFHSTSLQTTYVSLPGDHGSESDLPVASTTASWFFLSGVDVVATPADRVVVAFGDSITDGYGSSVDKNRRWPNLLAARLHAAAGPGRTAVLNQGISGNRLLHDLNGPNALARFDRDVLAVAGVRSVIVLEGINDIGLPGALGRPDQAVSADDLIAGYRQLIARAHARRLKMDGGTLTPFEGTTYPRYHSVAGEAVRLAVNRWIRSSGEFDAVVDFDLAVRNPARPSRLNPAYDSGDHLHPNDAGYRAMAEAIDLSLFQGN